jgi:putative FmdB family regulatory protein
MALYPYLCVSCGLKFDRFVAAEQRDEPRVCPDGHADVRRLLVSPAINPPDKRKLFRQEMSRTPGKHFT